MTDHSRTIWPFAYRAAFAVVAATVGALYLWCAQAANPRFEWRHDKSGYYDLLARGFASGHLYLPLDPAPQMLVLPNPLNYQQSGEWALQDAVLYHNRYYLYHGVTPALLLFLPWRLASGHDLPEAFAGFLFCFAGYLFACLTLLRMLAWAGQRPPLWQFGLLLLTLGISNPAPFLLQRVFVYEIAISGGYFCVSAGVWCFARAVLAGTRSSKFLAAAGFCFGLAIGCRPNLAAMGASAFALLAWWIFRELGYKAWIRSRELMAFLLPFALCVAGVAFYNHARFADPLEFGLRYQIADPSYANPKPLTGNLAPGVYHLFAAAPEFTPEFPFVRLVMRDFSLTPRRYVREPAAGAFAFSPLLFAVLLLAPFTVWPRAESRATGFFLAILSGAFTCAIGIASLGLISHRYSMDFVPYLLLCACFLSALPSRVRGVSWVTCLASFAGIFIGLALGVTGPNDEFVQKQPSVYAKLAGLIPSRPRYRPLHNPELLVEADFSFPNNMQGRVPLIAAGRVGSRYLLSAEAVQDGSVRLVSETTFTVGPLANVEVALLPASSNRIRLQFHAQTRIVQIEWNGQTVVEHALPFLVTSASQVSVGFDQTGFSPIPARFPGTVAVRSLLLRQTGFIASR
ncbi:MAG: hypothetical protein ABL967_02425 [Bryobacteraceae bacterium]